MTYRIASRYPLTSDGLPKGAFTAHFENEATAIATAIEGVDDPKEQEVRVVCVETGAAVWRSTKEEYEQSCN